ncbi:MAG: hypothetical protein BroJett024_33360 [Alphaproteobacteria bacterium]|nr:MAG: hypothetical protein BroJett024_33360 [Alphaproteobacteria bacterium]
MQDRGSVFAGPCEQTGAGRRREGHRDLELGVIGAAGPHIGLGPALVENVFAPGVGLQIAGDDPDELAAGILRDEMLGEPAGPRANRTRDFKRR